MHNKILFCLLFVVFIFGCTTTEVTMLRNSQPLPPTQNVEVLIDPPTRPYKQLAILETAGAAGRSETECIKNMKMKAQELGADAVILKHQETIITNAFVAQGMARVHGIAIKYESAP